MANFTFNVPDAKYDAIVDAFAIQEGYRDYMTDVNGALVPNTETKLQFAKKALKKKLTDAYVTQQVEIAKATAMTTASNEV